MYEKHGESGSGRTLIYGVWHALRNRCTNKHNPSYPQYGGRGIKVCEEWLESFPAFKEWAIANGYEERLTIDRIDNDGHYEPSNCRWVTMKVQNANKSNSRLVEIDGVTKTISEWAVCTGMNHSTIYYRYKTGIRGKELLSDDRLKCRSSKRMVEINGVSKTMKAWSDETGVGFSTMYYRHRTGLTGTDLFAKDRIPNRSSKCVVEINGISKTIRGWSEHTGIGWSTLYYRFKQGIRGEELIANHHRLNSKLGVKTR